MARRSSRTPDRAREPRAPGKEWTARSLAGHAAVVGRTTIEVGTGARYEVVVGPGVLAEAPRAIGAERAVVLADASVARLHGARLGELATLPWLTLPPGEASKAFPTLERVLDFLAAHDLDRRSRLVAFGGGVIGDLGGFAASIYMRGIAFVQCPTTLLAQVDASVGGKTAVNLARGKNLAGTFHQPAAVFADTSVLATLPEDEYLSGLGEVVKTALVGDAGLLELLEEAAERVRTRDADLLADLIGRAVRVKARVVASDAREEGPRKTLNLGHTFAHGIEHAAGFGTIPHGLAVAAGLVLALEASRRSGVLEDAALPARVAALLARLGLPASLAELRERSGQRLDAGELLSGMRHDKKGRAGEPALVLARRIGELLWDERIDAASLASLLA